MCWHKTETIHLDYDFCEKCDVSLPRLRLVSQARKCGRCDEMAFVYARSCGQYQGAFRESTLFLKDQPLLSRRMEKLLAETFQQLPNEQTIDIIIPVPLHVERQKTRTFNQAEIIAKALARATRLPINLSSLVRVNDTERHRAGMDAKARAKSLKGAFQVRATRLIEQQNILIVDDIMTTGSTTDEIARTLISGGANSVTVLTLTRAVTHYL